MKCPLNHHWITIKTPFKHPTSPHGHHFVRLKEEQELPGACIDPGGDAQDQAMALMVFEMVDKMVDLMVDLAGF